MLVNDKELSMNGKSFLKFMRGESISSILGTKSGSSLHEILNYNNFELEDDHCFIQWLFPSFRQSQFNNNAPILTISDILILRQDEQVKQNMKLAREKMLEYWGILPFDQFNVNILNGHNGLRLSRFIESSILFGDNIDEAMRNIQNAIHLKLVNPSKDLYKDRYVPIWYIRYYETYEFMNNI